jgi:hypothetical protein
MRTEPDLQPNQPGKTTSPASRLPPYVWLGGVVGRSLFLVILILLTARVASPQIEHLTAIYETPGDLIRVLLGVGVCSWFIVNLFILPKDAGAYRTWMYIGLAVIPLAVLCAYAVW